MPCSWWWTTRFFRNMYSRQKNCGIKIDYMNCTSRWSLTHYLLGSTVSAFSRYTIQENKYICLVSICGCRVRELISFDKTSFQTKSVNLRLQFSSTTVAVFQRLPTNADVLIKFPRPAEWVIYKPVSLPRQVGRHFHVDLQVQQQILIAYSTCIITGMEPVTRPLPHKRFIGKKLTKWLRLAVRSQSNSTHNAQC